MLKKEYLFISCKKGSSTGISIDYEADCKASFTQFKVTRMHFFHLKYSYKHLRD